MTRANGLRAFLRDARGTMAIETALVAPLLGAMALGAFDVSRMVAREQHLQSAANEASEIILAAANGTGISSADLETVLEESLNLGEGQVTLAQEFRCGTGAVVAAPQPTCATGQQLYAYVKVTVTDTFTPMWTNFGMGEPVDFNIVRTVQIK